MRLIDQVTTKVLYRPYTQWFPDIPSSFSRTVRPLLTTTSNSHFLPQSHRVRYKLQVWAQLLLSSCRHRDSRLGPGAFRKPASNRLALDHCSSLSGRFHNTSIHQFQSTVLEVTRNAPLGYCNTGSEIN